MLDSWIRVGRNNWALCFYNSVLETSQFSFSQLAQKVTFVTLVIDVSQFPFHIHHSSPWRLARIPDCPRHSRLTNSHHRPLARLGNLLSLQPRSTKQEKRVFMSLVLSKLIKKTRCSSDLVKQKFPVFPFLKPNRITQLF